MLERFGILFGIHRIGDIIGTHTGQPVDCVYRGHDTVPLGVILGVTLGEQRNQGSKALVPILSGQLPYKPYTMILSISLLVIFTPTLRCIPFGLPS
jgi:hypothetical protein